jgi:pimeloyl-ACP methyl ester carboxylesterase
MPKIISDLPHKPGENPFLVARGGFYRRWLQMINDLDLLEKTVATLTSTLDINWVPAWRELGNQFESFGDIEEKKGNKTQARELFLQAKTFYSIGRFPAEVSNLKAEVSRDCVRAYKKASKHLNPPIQDVEIDCGGIKIKAHYRTPKSETKVPAVLVMCGADVFKEDRGWAADMALHEGMASLVMDAPGTGENPFPWEPESVKAWEAAIDTLMDRAEIDPERVGAFGVSRGGYSVLQLAGTAPKKVKAVVAIAGHPFHNNPSKEDLDLIVETRNERAQFKFGEKDGPTWVPEWSERKEYETLKAWSLESLDLVDKISMPMLLINGDTDGLAPISNIHFMLEHGLPGLRSAKIYKNSGHCAFEHNSEWGPASFKWLAQNL